MKIIVIVFKMSSFSKRKERNLRYKYLEQPPSFIYAVIQQELTLIRTHFISHMAPPLSDKSQDSYDLFTHAPHLARTAMMRDTSFTSFPTEQNWTADHPVTTISVTRIYVANLPGTWGIFFNSVQSCGCRSRGVSRKISVPLKVPQKLADFTSFWAVWWVIFNFCNFLHCLPFFKFFTLFTFF